MNNALSIFQLHGHGVTTRGFLVANAVFSRFTRCLLVLGVETSCDDTCAAVVRSDRTILSNVVASQASKHTRFGGVTPKIAQSLHEGAIARVIDQALLDANVNINEVDAIAVTNRPGLPETLKVGCRAALSLCRQHNLPLLATHHMLGHALTPRLVDATLAFPYLCLLVSGGHCQLLRVDGARLDACTLLGESTHLAPGTLLDKLARRLKIKHMDPSFEDLSGGAIVEKVAELCTSADLMFSPQEYVPFRQTEKYSCNFLWSKMLYDLLAAVDDLEQQHDVEPGGVLPCVAQLCAAVLHLLLCQLASRLLRALEYTQVQSVVISGGVAANKYIRSGLHWIVSQQYPAVRLIAPPLQMCTDNAAMIAWTACELWSGDTSCNYSGGETFILPQCLPETLPVFNRAPFESNEVIAVRRSKISMPAELYEDLERFHRSYFLNNVG